jgi:NADP-dependent aldehyde dehydrogenase
MTFELLGTSFVGSRRGVRSTGSFTAYDPRTGLAVEPDFQACDPEELNRAVTLADEAFVDFAGSKGSERGALLRSIAANLEAASADLIARASLETGLPEVRFAGETARACGQLRMFAELVEDGSWVDARIDRAMPDRVPLPRPDIRSLRIALGPVAVFCASNFPIAFSVAGGDTASALAAGCPVVVNAHFAHPGTAEIAAAAIRKAVSERDLPEGVFSLLFSEGHETGAALVAHPKIKAVGFTGSRTGGRALIDIAARRNEPIPVFAEMSSVNPTFVLPRAAEERGEEIAVGLFASFTLGAGQFCTKPGIVVLVDSEASDEIVQRLKEMEAAAEPAPLLTSGIMRSYERGVAGRSGTKRSVGPGYAVAITVFEATAEDFLRDPAFQNEIFGPSTLIVRADSGDQLMQVAESLEGQLTATIQKAEGDLEEFPDLVPVLLEKAGRIVFDGYPTGVEVCHSMVHGGPYPATSDPRTTSVGTRAIERFTKLACFQNAPDEVLPDELRDENPLGIVRMVDGKIGRD